MIQLTRLNRGKLVLNSDLIEHIEATPDTVITLTTGHKFMVLEPAEEVIDRVVAFRRSLHAEPGFAPVSTYPVEPLRSNGDQD